MPPQIQLPPAPPNPPATNPAVIAQPGDVLPQTSVAPSLPPQAGVGAGPVATNQAAGRLLTAALREDLKVHSSDKPFTQDGVKFPSGSLILKIGVNPADLGDRLARLARETGAEIYGTN